MSGMDFLIKSLGLDEALEQVKVMADNGTFDKIVKFADGLDEIRDTLNAIRKAVENGSTAIPGASGDNAANAVYGAGVSDTSGAD